MTQTTYIATLINNKFVNVEVCDELPQFIHAVKYDQSTCVEVIFDAAYDWTPALENAAMSFVQPELYQQPA